MIPSAVAIRMNSSKLKMGLSVLQASSNMSASCLMNQTSKFVLTTQRNYFINFILEKSRLVRPSLIPPKKDEGGSFKSFAFLESFKERLARTAKIREIFGCDPREAASILQHAQEHFYLDDPEIFFEKLECLRKAGIDSTTILKNTWIFDFSLGELEKRLNYFNNDKFKDVKQVSLLKLTGKDLEILLYNLNCDEKFSIENRINFFSREFKLSIPEVCELLVQRSFLRKKPFEEIISIYSLLLGGGLTVSEIKKDFWVFNFSRGTIAQRINLAKSYSLEHFKCWMIRCSLYSLRRSAEKWKRNQFVLNKYSSRTEFLMDRLNLTADEVEEIYQKYPGVRHTSEAKLKLMIDYLLSENFTAEQIKRMPGAVTHNLTKLQSRMQQLREYDVMPRSLSPLVCSEKTFKLLMDRLERNEAKYKKLSDKKRPIDEHEQIPEQDPTPAAVV